MKVKPHVNSDSFLECDNDNCILAAGVMSIASHADTGNFINGPLSIPGPFTNIRFSNMFKFNSMLAFGLPSTVLTPISTFTVELPVKEAGTMMSLMGMILSTVGG